MHHIQIHNGGIGYMRRRTFGRIATGAVFAAAIGASAGLPAFADPSRTMVRFEALPGGTQLKRSSGPSKRAVDSGPRALYEVAFETDSAGVVKSKFVTLVRAPSLDAGQLATFVADTSGNVNLSWFDPSGGEIEWRIERDGAVIANIHGSQYTDHRGVATGSSMYVIYGERKLQTSDGEFVEPFTTVLAIQAVDPTPVGLKIDDQAALSAANNTDVLAAPVEGPTVPGGEVLRWETQLSTFIPTARAETPGGLQPCFEAYGIEGAGYYGGDDRGFARSDDDRPSARTSLTEGGANYVSNGETVSESYFVSKWTAGTKLFDANGVVVKEADADVEDGIAWAGAMGDEHGGLRTWKHSVADPLCAVAPAIDYKLSTGHYGAENGRFELYGSHDQAPSFEFRTKRDGRPWVLAYTFENRGLEYLLPTAPQARVDLNIPNPATS